MRVKAFLFWVLIIGIGIGWISCGTKKTVKQAEKYEAAGMFKEASDLYYQAHVKKPQKVDITIALKRSGQIYLEELSQNVSTSFRQGNYKETVYQYMAARNLIRRLKQSGVDLKADESMDNQFEDAKDYYLAERYKVGQNYIYESNFKEAKEVFKEIYNIDPDYKDTRSFLDQATFEPVYIEGSRLFAEGDYIGAYDNWEYINQSAGNYKDVVDRMAQALNERYIEGSLFLIDENFDDAAQALGEVHRRNPSYENVKALYTEARNEPIYRQAAVLMDEEKCRTAYYAYEQIIADAGKYKDADILLKDALQCAQYPIAIQSPVIRQNTSDAREFQSMLNSKLINLKNPFLKIYDLSAINSRLDESMKHSSGRIDANALKSVYERNNIKAILYCEFTDYEVKTGKEVKEQKTGFERQVTKLKNGETSIYDRQVKYTEISRENDVAVTISFKLISTETGEILLSDRVDKRENDRVEYAQYNGDKDKLYPSSFSNGTYSLKENGYRSLQRLLSQSSDIKSTDELLKSAFGDITGEVANDVNNFNPEK
jgi:tetratricopeptide (TPR) repeat protein